VGRFTSPVWLALAALGVLFFMQAGLGPGQEAAMPGLSGSTLEDFVRRHQDVSFSDLGAFHYRPLLPTAAAAALSSQADSIPPSIRALNGRAVRIHGFMLPTEYDSTGVSEFILNANYDMCAYGAPTIINQQVMVRMSDGKRTRYTHLPVLVFGTFRVGEEFSGDRVASIYQMSATALAGQGL
jgi:hypothetical protein